jgi:hypothetical protein
MIVVRIELWSARTGAKKELGVVVIDNIGGSKSRGDYRIRLARTWKRFLAGKLYREGRVNYFPRLSLGGFDLLLRGLLVTVGDRNVKAILNETDAVCRPGKTSSRVRGAGEGAR